jgi:hypothetical protein
VQFFPFQKGGLQFFRLPLNNTEMFGRAIAQTLALTPSRLITDTTDEFFGLLAKRGYKFVTNKHESFFGFISCSFVFVRG